MNCLECHIPMRGSRVPASEAPHTRCYGARGLCKTCANRERDGIEVVRENIREGFNEHQAKSALNAWLMDRRRRLQKLEGAWA